MDPLDGLTDFLIVAETCSFTEAARRIGTGKATVSERVNRLEKRLGVRLFERTSREVRLTEAGVAFHERLAGLRETVADAEARAADVHKKPRGNVRVTAPWIFAWQRLAPLLPEFLERHPGITVELSASNRVVDLVKERFDLAIRGSTHPSPGLIVRRLASHEVVLVASPSYLARRGRPATPADLEGHSCALFEDLPGGRRAMTLRRAADTARVSLQGALSSNSAEVLLAAVRGGYGFGIMPDFSVMDDLASGRLERILSGWRYMELVMHAVYPQNRQIAAKVRAFVEFLAKRL